MVAKYMGNALAMLRKGGKAVAEAKPPVRPIKPAAGATPLQLLEGVNEMVRHVSHYLVVAEQEASKRELIAAQREVAIKEIESQRETITELMKHTFAERALVIGKQFDALDHALAQGDLGLAQAALGAMVEVIKSSPFRTVQEMQQAMSRKDFVIRLE